MRTYGQYCPIARGAEIFAERWTPLIIRNLYLGCGSFNEILQGAPGLSRTLLSQRLKQLERLGVVTSAPKGTGRGYNYELTSAGHDLFKVCVSLGEWGARWLEIAPENLDPFVALWSMCHALRRDRLPDRRVVIRFDFTGRPRRERYWPKPPARAASNSTGLRRSQEPSQPGTPAACLRTPGRPPYPPRASQADMLDAADDAVSSMRRFPERTKTLTAIRRRAQSPGYS